MPRHEVMPEDVRDDRWLTRWVIEKEITLSHFDLCRECSIESPGKTVEELGLQMYQAEPRLPNGGYVLDDGSIEHPSYDDGEYRCEVCRKPLSEEVDGNPVE